jgi:hypothetical protein
MFKPFRYTSAVGTGLLNAIDSPEELTTLDISKPLPNAWSVMLLPDFNEVKLGPSAPRPAPRSPSYLDRVGKPI